MIRLRAACKLNFGLHIGEKRADGYHNLHSLFYPIPFPCDDLFISPGDAPGLNLFCKPEITAPGANILNRAYAEFAAAAGCAPAVKVIMHKRIPVGAGLGGGSSDAAVFLSWLNQACGLPLSCTHLARVAKAIGADVPFFLTNKPALVEGTGDIICPVEQSENFSIVVVWPDIKISTAWAFAEYDKLLARHKKNLNSTDPENTLTNCQNGDKNPISCDVTHESLKNTGILAHNFCNDLELPVFRKYPQLAALKQRLQNYGAIHSAMSGSGSTVFGIFSKARTAAFAAENLRKTYTHVYLLHLCPTGM